MQGAPVRFQPDRVVLRGFWFAACLPSALYFRGSPAQTRACSDPLRFCGVCKQDRAWTFMPCPVMGAGSLPDPTSQKPCCQRELRPRGLPGPACTSTTRGQPGAPGGCLAPARAGVKRPLFPGGLAAPRIQADELLFPSRLPFFPCSPGFFFFCSSPVRAASPGARAAPERSRPGGGPARRRCGRGLAVGTRPGAAARGRSCPTDRASSPLGAPGPASPAREGAGPPGEHAEPARPARPGWPPALTLPATPFPSGAWAQAARSVHLSMRGAPQEPLPLAAHPTAPAVRVTLLREASHPHDASGGSANLLL